jgi:hypothetical protein
MVSARLNQTPSIIPNFHVIELIIAKVTKVREILHQTGAQRRTAGARTCAGKQWKSVEVFKGKDR